MFDSKGVLYILHDHRIYKQARWVPVLDTANIVKEPTKPNVGNVDNVESKPKSSEKNQKRPEDLDIFDEINIVEKGAEKENMEKEKENEKEKEKEKENENEKEKEWIY